MLEGRHAQLERRGREIKLVRDQLAKLVRDLPSDFVASRRVGLGSILDTEVKQRKSPLEVFWASIKARSKAASSVGRTGRVPLRRDLGWIFYRSLIFAMLVFLKGWNIFCVRR